MEPTRIRKLIEQLAAPLEEVRRGARTQLISEGAAVAGPLREALGHPHRDVRAGAALCLAELKATEAALPLAALAAGDPDPSVRPLALRALAELAHPGCSSIIRQSLLTHVSNEDLFSRALACTGLGRIGDEECRQALGPATQDREEWVRQAARAALNAPAAAPPASAGGATTALARRPETSLAQDPMGELVAQLGALDFQVQRRAQEALRAMGPAAIPRLVPLLRDEAATTRRAATELLGSIAAVEGLAPLAEQLRSEACGDELRAITLHAISHILGRAESGQGSELSALLREQLDRPDPFVRGGAAAALMSARGLDRRAILESLLDADAEWPRLCALRSLAQTASPLDRQLVPLLLDYLAALSDAVGQVLALEALRLIMAGAREQDCESVMGTVTYFLDSEHSEVRFAAGRLLAQLGGRPGPAGLRSTMLLIEEAPHECRELIRALPRLVNEGDAAPVPALRQVLTQSALELARDAAMALAGIGGRAAVDALVEVANGHNGAATAVASQALATLPARAQVVAARVPDGKWERRIQLLCACGSLLRWVERNGREELRCPSCDEEYIVSQAGKLFPEARTPFGVCRCSGCRRKQPLVRRQDSEVLVCPISGEVHIRPFDHPRQVHRLADLPLGACACCAEPQPLVRINEEVRCYRSRDLYRATPRGFEPASTAAPSVDDVAAINRALLAGTLAIAESGLAATSEEEPEAVVQLDLDDDEPAGPEGGPR